MPTFIKTGYWEKIQKGYKGWLNLDDLIGSSIGTGTTNFIPKYVGPNTLGNSNINATSNIITSTFTSSTSYVGQSGNTRFGFAGNTATLIFTQGLPFAIGTFSNHPLVLGTNNTENVRIFLDGNVGVGTGDSNAGYKLDVNGTARVQGGSIAAGARAFIISATLPDATGLQYGTYISATSSGTLGRQFALNIDLLAGYTGTFATAGFQGSNSAQGTGSEPFNGTTYGNVAANLNSVGVTIGTNYGLRSNATGGNVNYGVFSNTTGAKASATNIAVAGFSLNSGATPTNIGGYFGLQNVIPTFTSAALIADNGTTTSPIFIARDNGVSVFTIADGGNVLATQYNLSALNTAPASATATGTLGEIRIDANHIYVCTATNTWKRVAIATW